MDTGITNFGILGARALIDQLGSGTLDLAVSGGRGSSEVGSAWFDVALGGDWARWFGAYSFLARAEAFGLRYSRPWGFGAYGVSLLPRASRTIRDYTLTLSGDLTRGRWSMDDSARVNGPLAMTGGAVEIGRTIGPAWVETTGSLYRARNSGGQGAYGGLAAELAVVEGPVGLSVGTRWWQSAAGAELGYHAAVNLRLEDDLSLQLVLGKTVSDPLYGSPGGVIASLGGSWRLMSRQLTRSQPVVEFADAVEGGRRVRFRLAVDAERVALVGDFTGWSPRPMRRSDDAWTLELVLAPGLHHFGFMLDDQQWFVPDEAPGIVDDGWGRRNASVLVEGP